MSLEHPQTSWPLRRPPEPTWPTSRGFGEALAGAFYHSKLLPTSKFQHRCVRLGQSTAREGGHGMDFLLSPKPPSVSFYCWTTTVRMGSLEGGKVGNFFFDMKINFAVSRARQESSGSCGSNGEASGSGSSLGAPCESLGAPCEDSEGPDLLDCLIQVTCLLTLPIF